MKKAVIIGGGIAGITAAAELRKLHPHTDLDITVISAENPADYSRVRLPEYIAGKIPEETLVLHKNDWFTQQSINILTDTKADAIHRDNKTVSIQKAGTIQTMDYDILIITSGAYAFSPCMPSVSSPSYGKVFTLRTLSDARAIKERIKTHTKAAAVIGGGLLGIEAARAIKAAGVQKVCVIETAPYLLPRQLDKTAAAMLTEYLTLEGLTVYTGISIDLQQIETRSPEEIFADTFKEKISVETLIFSMGVRSETALAKSAGLDCGKGITVDNTMKTSDAAIFAAGDCAEFEGIVWGIVPAALEQAKTAAQYAAFELYPDRTQKPEPYRQTVPRTTLSIGNKETVSAGKAVLSAQEEGCGNWKEVIFTGDTYVRLLEDTKTGIISGGLAFGNNGTGRKFMVPLQKAIGKPAAEVRETLTKLLFPAQ